MNISFQREIRQDINVILYSSDVLLKIKFVLKF